MRSWDSQSCAFVLPALAITLAGDLQQEWKEKMKHPSFRKAWLCKYQNSSLGLLIHPNIIMRLQVLLCQIGQAALCQISHRSQAGPPRMKRPPPQAVLDEQVGRVCLPSEGVGSTRAEPHAVPMWVPSEERKPNATTYTAEKAETTKMFHSDHVFFHLTI